MSAAVYRTPVASFPLGWDCMGTMLMPTAAATRESLPFLSSPTMPSNYSSASAQQQRTTCDPSTDINKVEEAPSQFWSMLFQPHKVSPPPAPYVHPLARRFSTTMSDKSLEMCTESLGSETGSDGFSSDDDNPVYSSSSDSTEEKGTSAQQQGGQVVRNGREDLRSVNYHCSISRRSPPRSFPPPLRSISQHDGSCILMRPHRIDGRLIVNAIPVPPQTYLHASRQDGRLRLSFVESTFHQTFAETPEDLEAGEQQAGEGSVPEDEFCNEEEEVEVVDRWAIVEVKVSTLPQKQQRGETERPHVSNLEGKDGNNFTVAPGSVPSQPLPHLAATATTVGVTTEVVDRRSPITESKLLSTSKERSREEALHHVRRCSQLRGPFFFRNPCRIATS